MPHIRQLIIKYSPDDAIKKSSKWLNDEADARGFNSEIATIEPPKDQFTDIY